MCGVVEQHAIIERVF